MVNKLTGLEGGLEVGQKINEIIDAKADVNSSTTGNARTATKLQNARTITLSGDVSGSVSFDGSVNKTVTTTLNNTTKIDGQWVSKTETLSTATAVGTYTIDLSSYLPNDNYNYEVLFQVDLRETGNGAIYTITSEFTTIVFSVESGSSSDASRTRVPSILPISSNKSISLNISSKLSSGTGGLTALAYRRIGSNT